MTSTRSRSLLYLVSGLLIAAGVAAAVYVLGGFGDEDAPDLASLGVAPFTVPDGPPTAISADRISVTASSHLEPAGDITYGPENVLDDDIATAWNSDAPNRDGRGETLTFRFSQPVNLQGLRFVNGYTKNPEIFTANHRIRDLVITADGRSQQVTLLDTGDRQEITVDFGLTSKVELEVMEIYPGAGFDNPALTADLALTEVSFLAVQ